MYLPPQNSQNTINKMSSTASVTSNTSTLICTMDKCVDDQDIDVLKCCKCERSVHYRCTRLPAYQIQLFKSTKRKKYQYQCQNCVQVPQELLDLIPNKERSHPSLKTERELERLQQDVKNSEDIIKKQKENENHFLKLIEDQQKELTDLKGKLQSNPGYHTLEYVEDQFEKNFKISSIASKNPLKE